MIPFNSIERIREVLDDIEAERMRQLAKWGRQDWPDGTSHTAESIAQANTLKAICDVATKDGRLTWRHILREEVAEALAETDWIALRKELIQVAAVCAAWVEAGDDREDGA